MNNNAYWNLLGTLTAWATTMTIKDSRWGLFPSVYPYQLTLEKLVSWIVTKREIVNVTNRVWDTFTITRAYESCPLSDSSTTQQQIAQSFDDGDLVQMRLTAWKVNTIETNITNLWTTKLDKSTYNAEKIAYASSSWWTDDYVVTIPDITAYTDWQTFKIKADVWNTWTATLNVNWLWAKTLKKLNTTFTDLATWDLIATQIFFATYNSSSGGFFQFSVDPAQVIIPDVASTKSTFVAWENITSGDAIRNWIWYIDNLENVTQLNWWSYLDLWVLTTTQKLWQTFKLLSSNILNSIKVQLYKMWSPTDNIQCNIYSSAWWTLLGTATNTISWTTMVTSAWTDYTFNFNHLNLVVNTTYFIEISRTWALNNTNYYRLVQSTSNSYANWTPYYYWGTWDTVTNDFYFSIFWWTFEDTTKAYKTDATNSSKINFIWFATNTVSTWWNVTVDTAWVSATQSGLTVWSDYYLSNTPWAISTTPWTNVVSVGKAVITTWIEINTNYKNIINQTSLFTTLNVSRNTVWTTTSSTYQANNDYFATFQNDLYCAWWSYTVTTTIQYSTDWSTWINIANNSLTSPSISWWLTNNYISSVYLLKWYYYRTTAYSSQSTNATSAITLVNLIKI